MTALSKKNILKSFNYLIITLFTLFYACQKDPSEIGLSLQNENEIINGNKIDTTTIKAYTIREDSLTSDERTYALLGSMLDPVFGYSEASFITQMRLASSNVSFGTSPVADSMIIYLDYRSYYGDTTLEQSFDIYEIEKSIYLDSTYYSNLNVQNYIPSAKIIASKTYRPKPNDSCLVVRLSDTFAQQIIEASTTQLQNNDNFIAFFKGFLFKPHSNLNQAAIIYFNLLSSKSKVTLYYHNSTETNLKYDFVFNSSCARINLFNHNYTPCEFNPSINNPNTNDSLLYLQAMSGLNAKITFPNITNFAQMPLLAFVRAELIIPIKTDDATATLLKAPAKLLLVAYNSSGTYEFLPDFSVGTDYFGGNANTGYTEYRFNISRYIQQLAYNQRQDFGIALFVADNRISANRVIIKGPKCVNGMRLSITYLKP